MLLSTNPAPSLLVMNGKTDFSIQKEKRVVVRPGRTMARQLLRGLSTAICIAAVVFSCAYYTTSIAQQPTS